MSEQHSESALPADWQSRDLAGMYAQYTRLCRDEHERGLPVPLWYRPRVRECPAELSAHSERGSRPAARTEAAP